MPPMKTPGVYIIEKSAFPSSVVEVATAVPAFIGYTETADNKGKSLANTPWRITSAAEYHAYFGGAPKATVHIEEDTGKTPQPLGGAFTFEGKRYRLTRTGNPYLLYHSMLLFFQNGGGPCYIVSVGDYAADIETDRLRGGIEQLVKEQEPTMVVVPDAVRLDFDNCTSVQQAVLQHCGGKMKNRFGILDVWQGYKSRQDKEGDPVANFRDAVGINFLDFAAAYYPWLNTTIVQDADLSYENIDNPDVLQKLLSTELTPKTPEAAASPRAKMQAAAIARITNKKEDWKDSAGNQLDDAMIASEKSLLNKSLIAMSPLFNTMLKEVKDSLNLLPPSAAMAGIYTMVDNTRGVWKAPANVSLSSVVSPAVNITHDDQEDLNVTTQGKSINAIRAFIGEGTLVWGSRTLDGNSLDWRYVNVRRTMLMLEESIRLAAKAYVFENNDANTWVTIKSTIRNFLTNIWKRGGLAGATPDDAFSVHVGLGETMTPEDILEGILRVTVLVALIRPAEFIEITFQQQMQKS
jgi:phage tail sheath protein FI